MRCVGVGWGDTIELGDGMGTGAGGGGDVGVGVGVGVDVSLVLSLVSLGGISDSVLLDSRAWKSAMTLRMSSADGPEVVAGGGVTSEALELILQR